MTGAANRLENGDSKSYWAAASEGRLEFQRCTACGHTQFPPRFQCETCWSDQLAAVESSGQGVVESLTVVRRAPLPAFRGKVPYVVASIRVAEGPRMITNLVGDGALEAAIGDRVEVVFEPNDDGVMLPQFQRAG